jgi:PAT family beta-lactamase induction signal transducer AmpG
MPGKALKGLSGWAVQSLAQGRTLLEGYALFFTGTALIGIPVVILCALLIRQQRKRAAAA